MSTTSLLSTAVMVGLSAALTCFSPVSHVQATTTNTVSIAADEDLAPLKRKFDRLYDALVGLGGISDRERPLVRDLRDRFAAFNDQHQDHATGLSAELQLSIWLKDGDRVDELFPKLIRLKSDNLEFGRAWSRFASNHYDEPRIDQVYRTLFDLYPTNVELRVTRAQQLKRRNEYPRALELLGSVELDAEVNIRGMLLKADCLYAEHRFEEALETLNRIPSEALADRRELSREIEDKMLLLEEYVALWEIEQIIRSTEASVDDLPRVQLNTERGVVIVELFENEAPNTVANFISLVEDGFYDGTRFHRVIPNFMAQGGDPHTKDDVDGTPGQGGPGWRIRDEHDLDDHRLHFSGSLAMAKSAAPDSAGSQFYLTVEPTPHLNGQHTVFGRVLEGLDVVRSLQRNDLLESAVVLRKRDHHYKVEKLFGDDAREPEVAEDDDEPGLIFSPGRQ